MARFSGSLVAKVKNVSSDKVVKVGSWGMWTDLLFETNGQVRAPNLLMDPENG